MNNEEKELLKGKILAEIDRIERGESYDGIIIENGKIHLIPTKFTKRLRKLRESLLQKKSPTSKGGG